MTIFIQQAQMIAISANSQSGIVTDKNQFPLREIDDMTHQLSELMTWINRYIAKTELEQALQYRVILFDDFILQRALQPPNLSLHPYELEKYIENSLTKIFHTQARLNYDYLSITEHEKPVILQVYAYPSQRLQSIMTIFSKHNLSFIGTVDTTSTELINLDNIQLEFETIACQSHIENSINFLPWRQKIRESKRRNFFVMISVIMLFFIILLFSLFWQKKSLQNSLLSQKETFNHQLIEKKKQLANLIQVDKKIAQLHQNIAKRQQLQKQITVIVDYLNTISNLVPKGVWLESLVYQDDTIQLKGDSILYADILAFSQALNGHSLVKTHRILGVKQNNYLLHFDFDIQFISLNDRLQ